MKGEAVAAVVPTFTPLSSRRRAARAACVPRDRSPTVVTSSTAEPKQLAGAGSTVARMVGVPFSGGCACGAIRYTVTAEPLVMVNCHCRACQRASGGAYATGFIVPTAAVRIEGEPRWYESKADSGNIARRGFCSVCGSPLFAGSTGSRGKGMSIRAASLDDPSWFKVQADIWMKTAQPWASTDPSVPKHDTLPDVR